jgi:uncharacterized protein
MTMMDRRHWLRAGLMAAGVPAALGLGLAWQSGWAQPKPMPSGTLRDLTWEDLVPPDWDPSALIKAKRGDIFSDADPRAQRAMRQLREVWDNAPTVDKLEGVHARIAGYVIPLDPDENQVRELLLVPYFGACIHTPPPPANQIVQVKLAKASKMKSMDVFNIVGLVRVKRSDSSHGKTGYLIEQAVLEPYKFPDR